MFLYFIIAFGAMVAINALASSLSRVSALKLTAFILAMDFGASIAIQTWTALPGKPVWYCLLYLAIILLWYNNRNEYPKKSFLYRAIPSGYLTMIALNVTVLFTKGGAELLCEIVSDVIFVAILGTNLVSGVRYVLVDLGDGNHGRDINLRPRIHNRLERR